MPADRFAPATEEARALARRLIAGARHAALAVTDAETGLPGISRIGLVTGGGHGLLSLMSDLAPHKAALRADPACALLLGEPGPRGDPLTHPRLSLSARATIIPRDSRDHADLRAQYLAANPKARLYVDLGDFNLVRFVPTGALLNGGFGRAHRLTAQELGASGPG